MLRKVAHLLGLAKKERPELEEHFARFPIRKPPTRKVKLPKCPECHRQMKPSAHVKDCWHCPQCGWSTSNTKG